MNSYYHYLIDSYFHYTDPAASHLPNVDSIDGLMNLLSACVLVVLGNVLDFRTYRAPTQEENQKANKSQQILIDHDFNTIPFNERLAICYSRGVALHLINWVRHSCMVTGPEGENVPDLPSLFFVQIAQTLIKYKEGANSSGLELQANCTLDMLTRQIENVVKIDSHFTSLWSERHSLPSNSLTLSNQNEYSVNWLPDIQQEWSSEGQEGMFNCCICYPIALNLSLDFVPDGITDLDENFFNTQKNRQHLELSQVIPQLTKDHASSARPSKRTKID